MAPPDKGVMEPVTLDNVRKRPDAPERGIEVGTKPIESGLGFPPAAKITVLASTTIVAALAEMKLKEASNTAKAKIFAHMVNIVIKRWRMEVPGLQIEATVMLLTDQKDQRQAFPDDFEVK